jgi:hypothetical protein
VQQFYHDEAWRDVVLAEREALTTPHNEDRTVA